MKRFFSIVLLCTAVMAVSCNKENGQKTDPEDDDNIAIITFDSRGAGEVAPQKVEVGGFVIEPDAPTLTEYEFRGWYAEDTDEKWDFNRDVVNRDMVLYARWAMHKPGSVTVMYYGAGGGNLDYQQVYKMRQCVSLGATDLVNMTFQFKFSKAHQSEEAYQNHKGVLRMDLADADSLKGCQVYAMNEYNILKNLSGLPFTQYSADAELDMSRPEEICDFIKWSIDLHPADKYVLIFADHGSGWNILDDEAACIPSTKGVIYDDNVDAAGNDKCVSAKNIKDAIDMSGASFEILYLDACLMTAWENLYEYRTAAVKYYVGSMEVGYGGNYNLMMKPILAEPTKLYDDFKKYIDDYITDFGKEYSDEYVDFDIADLEKITTITPIIKEIKETLIPQLTSTDEIIKSNASAAFRLGLMAAWSKVSVPINLGKVICSTYPGCKHTESKDGEWYNIDTDYVILYRKNHRTEWDAFNQEDTDNAIYNIMNQDVYGLAMGDVLKQYRDLWADVQASGYDTQKKTAEALYEKYINAVKDMFYVRCTNAVYADQEYVELSPSVNVMAMNKAGWIPWTIEQARTDFNSINMANNFTLEEAIALYAKSTFDKQTGWGDLLKVNPYNPSPLSNDSRLGRYYKK